MSVRRFIVPACAVWVALNVYAGELAFAHQPVMDMAPRWQRGYGVQVRHVWRESDQLKDGDADAANPFGREQRVNTTWLEGVYTFTRAARVTFKLPWIDQSRTVVRGGVPVKETGNGLGDLILGVPLKRYHNRGSTTGNIGLTPNLRLPTGSTSDAFPTGDGSTDVGLSVSYNRETPKTYQLYELFYWANTRGSKGIAEGDELGLDVNLGLHPYHNNQTNTGVFVMWDVSVRYEERGVGSGGTTGGTRISTGPIVVWYRGNMMFRAEFKYPAYERVEETQVSFGPELNVGIGMAF